jgi:hypothetical protein
MAIDYGLLDTTLPEKLGAVPSNALAKYAQTRMQMEDQALSREHAKTQNALAGLHLTQGQRAMNEEDAYKAALAGVQNGDYAAAMPDLMKASPTRALALRKGMAEEQKAGVEGALSRFKLIDHVAGQFAANPTRQTGVWVLSQLAANGTPQPVIQEMSAKLNAAPDADLPKMAQAFLAATTEGIKAHADRLFPKAPQPTELGRLISERDALPEGDPRRAAYDQAISKASTHTPPQSTPYFTFLPSGEGYLAGNNRTGTAAPVIVNGKTPLRASDDPTLQGRVAAEKERGKTVAGADVKRERGAVSTLNVLDEAEQWIDRATSSYAGSARDVAARAVGVSTEASQAAARLKVLQGALMMAQPRMEGPQSDKDVALYREMAGRLGDTTVPAAEKRAAVATIRSLQQKYLPQNGDAPIGAPSAVGARTPAPAGMDSMPPPAEHTGRTIRDSSTGVRYRSDGRSWVRVQ